MKTEAAFPRAEAMNGIMSLRPHIHKHMLKVLLAPKDHTSLNKWCAEIRVALKKCYHLANSVKKAKSIDEENVGDCLFGYSLHNEIVEILMTKDLRAYLPHVITHLSDYNAFAYTVKQFIEPELLIISKQIAGPSKKNDFSFIDPEWIRTKHEVGPGIELRY